MGSPVYASPEEPTEKIAGLDHHSWEEDRLRELGSFSLEKNRVWEDLSVYFHHKAETQCSLVGRVVMGVMVSNWKRWVSVGRKKE